MSEQSQTPDREERTVRLASIVAIDIVGFSTMSERNQEKAARHVESLRARIERVAAAHGGRVFNTAGDGFMLEFSSAGAALEAIQDVLDKRGKGEPRVRVGAHVGDVVVTIGADLLGHGVNVAARLQALARPGSALVSAEFRSMARTSPSAAFQAKGRQPLENIEQRVQTFEILSRRQKLARFMRRAGATGLALAAATALFFVSPTIWRFAQGMLNTNGEADAVTAEAAPQAAYAPASGEIEAAPNAGRRAGETFSDCAACPDMVVLPGGLFVMGSPESEPGRNDDEGPAREVSIAPIAISRMEITFAQWDACLAGGGCNGYSPPDQGWGRGPQPAIGVSWDDAQAYLDWLNAQAGGLRYRLLTEAEWEYAARAGGRAAFGAQAALGANAAVFASARSETAGVRPPNAFGLYDMAGNAAEWVEDCYTPDYALAPVDGAAVNAEPCAARVLRGGGYGDPESALRAAARRAEAPTVRGPSYGVRVARVLE